MEIAMTKEGVPNMNLDILWSNKLWESTVPSVKHVRIAFLLLLQLLQL